MSQREPDPKPAFEPSYPPTLAQYPASGNASDRATGAAPAPTPGGSASSHFSGNRETLRDLIRHHAHDPKQPIVERYRLLEEIGYGGFGVVWKAQPLQGFDEFQSEDFVAIKFFVGGDSGKAGEVLAEVSKMKSVKGTTGVLPVHDTYSTGIPPHGIPHYVMDFAKNGSLQGRIERKTVDDDGKAVRVPTPMSRADAALTLLRIARTLKFVHEHDLVHGDLKPANVLLNEAGEPLLADFGQAQRGSESEGQGTFFYMAPERATLDRIKPDPRWDVFSFGALAYALLVGAAPWWTGERYRFVNEPKSRKEKFDRYRKVLYEARQPNAHHKACDAELAAIVDRCLSPAPSSRPKDGAALVELLEGRLRSLRKKPLLRSAALVTFGVLAGGAILGLLVARSWVENLRTSTTRSIHGALAPQAYLGSKIVEEKLADRVSFVEYMTDERMCTNELRTILAGIGAKLGQRGENADPLALITPAERAIADRWLGESVYPVLCRRLPFEQRNLGLLLVVNHTKEKKQGFFLSRISGQATSPLDYTPSFLPAEDRLANRNRHVYERDWSFRDYFNGVKNDFDRQKESHSVIRTTHISHVYKSFAKAEDGVQPWKIDVSTPIWEDPKGPRDDTNRVVGLLVCGLDVAKNLDAALVPIPSSDELRRDPAITMLIVNDRGHWVRQRENLSEDHFRATKGLADPGLVEDPHLREFLVADANDAVPFFSEQFMDRVSPEAEPEKHLTVGGRLSPYKTSRDPTLRQKHWAFLAKIDQRTAWEPVEDIRSKLMWGGASLFAAMTTLVVALWVWLIRLLRRTEFSSHA